MARGRQSIRQLKLLNILNRATRSNKPVRISRLCKLLDVSRRTIYRDIRQLEDAGFAIRGRSNGDFKDGVCLHDPIELPKRQLELSEYIVLQFARECLSRQPGTDAALVSELLATFDKAIKPEVKDRIERIRSCLNVATSPPRIQLGDGNIFSLIVDGMSNNRVMDLKYYSAHRNVSEWRSVHPYQLTQCGVARYLEAYCEKSNDIRTFAINRIEQAKLSNRTFSRDKNIAERIEGRSGFIMYDGSPKNVRLLFDADKAFYATERTWHEKQTVKHHDDGKVEICFKTSGIEQLAGFVLRWGGSVEVLEPRILREKVWSKARLCVSKNVPKNCKKRKTVT